MGARGGKHSLESGLRGGLNHVRAACEGVHPAQILNALVVEAERWPDAAETGHDFRARRHARIIALKSQGWKQSAIAVRLGISDSLVSKIIRTAARDGARQPLDQAQIQRRTARKTRRGNASVEAVPALSVTESYATEHGRGL